MFYAHKLKKLYDLTQFVVQNSDRLGLRLWPAVQRFAFKESSASQP